MCKKTSNEKLINIHQQLLLIHQVQTTIVDHNTKLMQKNKQTFGTKTELFVLRVFV